MGHYPYGIKNMLQTSNLKQIGNIHSGMGRVNFSSTYAVIMIIIKFSYYLFNQPNFKYFSDDCVNIINIMNHLARRGCLFEATNKLSSV